MDLLSSLKKLRRMTASTGLEFPRELHTMMDDLASDMSVREIPPPIDNDISSISIESFVNEPDLKQQVLQMREFNDQMRRLVSDKFSRFKEANRHKPSLPSPIFEDINDMKQTMRDIKKNVHTSDTNIQIILCKNDIEMLKNQMRLLDNQISKLNSDSKLNKLQVENIKDTVVNLNPTDKHRSICQIF